MIVIEHRCPPGLRTERSRRLERLRVLDLRFLGRRHAEQVREDITELQQHFADHVLCTGCGYPLDNSAPHPEAS